MNKFFLLTVLTAFLVGCSSNANPEAGEDSAQTQRAPKITYVEVAELQTGLFEHFIETQGTIETDNNIWVTPKANGEIVKIYFREGDWVKKGQLMIKLDDEILQKNIAELEASLEFATIIYEKQKSLWDQNIGTEIQYLTAKNNKESLEKKLVTIKEQLEFSKVKSPISGYVDDVRVKIGEIAMPGMPVMRVVNLREMKVKAKVPENYAAKVSKGQPLQVILPDLDAIIDAKISYVGQVVDPLNRTFPVIAKFPQTKAPVKPNMVAQVRISDFSKADAIAIPLSVLQHSEEGDFVYVAKKSGEDFVAEKRPIEKGLAYGGRILVKSGLEAGEKVITFGFQNLKEGGLIKF